MNYKSFFFFSIRKRWRQFFQSLLIILAFVGALSLLRYFEIWDPQAEMQSENVEISQKTIRQGPSNRRVSRAFYAVDLNKDYRLTLDEVLEARRRRFDFFDKNKDSQLSLVEHLQLPPTITDWQEVKDKNLRRKYEMNAVYFYRQDLDGDGWVTALEYDQDQKNWFSSRDKDGDGVILPHEWGYRRNDYRRAREEAVPVPSPKEAAPAGQSGDSAI